MWTRIIHRVVVVLQELAYTANQFIATLQQHGLVVLLWLGIAFAVQILNISTNYKLNVLGIYPRHWYGLIGIITSPFIHGNWGHFISNAAMFVIMSLFVLAQGIDVYITVTLMIMVLSGLMVWLLARRALHIGASGVIMGYFGFIVVSAIAHPSIVNISLTIVCLYYFGSMFMNLFPSGAKVSWEGHVFGFISGIVVSFSYPIVISFLHHPI